MKKPLLATVGLVGACAACCAIPLLIPILSGTFVGVFTIAGLDSWKIDGALIAVATSVVTAFLVGLGIRHIRRRCNTCALPGLAGTSSGVSAGCGCSTPTRSPKNDEAS